MKFIYKVFCLLLSIVCAFVVAGCNPSQTVIDINKSYKPLPAGYDTYLYENPDRGFRTEMLLHFKPTLDGSEKDFRTMGIDEGFEANKDKIDRIFKIYFPGHMEYKSKTVIFYTFFDGYNKGSIPNEIFELLQYAFDICRTQKIKVNFRVSYSDLLINHHLSEENKALLSKKCADQNTMLSHMEQFSQFLSNNKEIIHKISAGFIGYMGEMGEVYQYPSVDYNTIIKGILDKICTPNGFHYSARTPQMLQDFLSEYPEYEHKIGLCNETIYGEQERIGWAPNSGLQWHNSNGYWEYVCSIAAYTPQSGELLVNSSYLNPNNYKPLKGIEVAAQLAHHRYAIFSQWHTLYENWGQDNVMKRWIEEEFVSAADLDAKGMIYDPSWFYDEDGIETVRNPYEYIRDHLGYKIVAENSTLKGTLGKSGQLSVDMSFKNYGFSAAFFMESGFALLDEDYNVVYSVKSGEPDKWISLPIDYFVEDKTESVLNDVITYNISADIKLPAEKGKYYVAFYLKNSMNDFAAISNHPNVVLFVGDGYNILHSIVIE